MSGRTARLAATTLLAVALAAIGALWPASRTPSAATTPVAVAAEGGAVFQAKGCSGCHHAPGVAGGLAMAPDLEGLAERAADRVAGLGAEEYVRQSIRQPQAHVVAGYEVRMPTLSLSDEELTALVAYLLG